MASHSCISLSLYSIPWHHILVYHCHCTAYRGITFLYTTVIVQYTMASHSCISLSLYSIPWSHILVYHCHCYSIPWHHILVYHCHCTVYRGITFLYITVIVQHTVASHSCIPLSLYSIPWHHILVYHCHCTVYRGVTFLYITVIVTVYRGITFLYTTVTVQYTVASHVPYYPTLVVCCSGLVSVEQIVACRPTMILIAQLSLWQSKQTSSSDHCMPSDLVVLI